MTGAFLGRGTGPRDEHAPEYAPDIDEQAIADALADVWAGQQDTVRAQVSELEMASAALLTGSLNDTLKSQLRSTAHKLAGSLGSFGFFDGTQAARRIESLLGQDHPDPRAMAEVTVRLRDSLPPEGWRPTDTPEPPLPETQDEVLFVITDDTGLSTALENECRLSPYSCLVQPHPIPATPIPRTGALIIDVHGYGMPAVDRELSALRTAYPLFFLVDGDDEETRSAAVGMGALGVLQRDSSPGQIIRFVEATLAGRHSSGPIRVLGIGPEELQAAFDPEEVQQLIKASWVPDITAAWTRLMNSALPDAVVTTWGRDGAEALRTLRADPRTAGLPVVVAVPHPDVLPEALESGAVAVPTWSAGHQAVPDVTVGLVSLAGRLRGLAHDDPIGTESWTDARRTLARMAHRAERTNTRVALAQVEIHRSGLTHGDLPPSIRHLVGRRLREVCPAEDLVSQHGDRFVIAAYGTSPEVLASRLEQARLKVLTDRVRRPSGGEAYLDLRAAVAALPHDGASIPDLFAVTAAGLATTDQDTPIVTRSGRPVEQPPHEVDLVLIEDDATTAALVERALNLRNLTCVVIGNGAEAAEALARGRIVARMVLLDIGLPGMDGFGVLSRINREDSLFRSPVVVLSSRYQEQEVQRAFSLGAIDHITKPFGIPALLHRIDRVLQGASR